MIYKNIYKISYVWYEGESGASYVLTNLDKQEIESILIGLFNNLESKYLPDKYSEILEKLSTMEDIAVSIDYYDLPSFCCLVEYNVDDEGIIKITQEIKREKI